MSAKVASKVASKEETSVESKVATKKMPKAKASSSTAVQVEPVVVKEPVLPAAPAEPAPEPVVDEPQLDEAQSTSEPKKKLSVAKGSVVVQKKTPAKKAAAKSPKASPQSSRAASKSPKASPKAAARKPAAKSPSKAKSPAKTASKSPARKAGAKAAPKAATKKGGARVAQKGKGKAAAKTAKTAKPRRPVNTKPAPIDFSGIGIGPAKVKKVLMHHAFNPKEYAVRLEILKAENKPVKPKPTEENPDPVMPAQGPQTPVDKLPKATLDVVRAAERAHHQSLTSDYEHHVVSEMSEADKKAYNDARKEAAKAENFDLHAFNGSQNKKFYAGFDAWCKENDSYALGRVVKDKKGVERERFNQWSRAMALVNKSCLRLSSGVRDILACYLDSLVVQYARNGIVNCVAEEHSNLQLRHALTPSDGFDERVPMDAFARTLDGYQLALNWIESCRQTREEIRETRKRIKKGEIEGDTVSAELPDYPDPEYDENFEGYVVEICRSVRMQMAESQKTAADKAKYHNIKVSENFKRFCSIIIYESILRIGAHLKAVVELKDVKTVNEDIMYHTLQQVSNLCGIPFEPIRQDLKTRLEKFRVWCAERRAARKAKKDANDAEDPDAEEDGDEDAEEDAEADPEANAGDDVVAGDGDEDAEEDAEAEEDAKAEEAEEDAEAEEELDVEYEDQ